MSSPFFLKVSIGALDKTRSAWAAAGLSNQQEMIGGLLCLWEQCWRRKRLEMAPIEVCSFFSKLDTEPGGQSLMRALVAFGFVAIDHKGHVHIIDEKDRLGIRKHQNRQAGATKAREKKAEKARLKETGDQSQNSADQGVDQGHDQALIKPSIRARSTLIAASQIAREPDSYLDHDLSTPDDLSLLDGGPNSLTRGAGDWPAQQANTAQPAESGTTGDHAARAKTQDLGSVRSVGDIAKASGRDVVRGLVEALRANTPPEPQIRPPEPQPPPVKASPAPAPTPLAKSPTQPSQAPLPEKQEGQIGNSIEALVPHLSQIYKAATGLQYPWKAFEKEIIGELLVDYTGWNITSWWRGALADKKRNPPVREIKALKRMMLAESARDASDPEYGMIKSLNSEISPEAVEPDVERAAAGVA